MVSINSNIRTATNYPTTTANVGTANVATTGTAGTTGVKTSVMYTAIAPNQAEKDRLKSQISSLENDARHLQSQIEVCNDELAQANNTKLKHKRNLEKGYITQGEYYFEMKALEGKISNINKNKSALQSQLSQINAQLSSLRQQLEQLENGDMSGMMAGIQPGSTVNVPTGTIGFVPTQTTAGVPTATVSAPTGTPGGW